MSLRSLANRALAARRARVVSIVLTALALSMLPHAALGVLSDLRLTYTVSQGSGETDSLVIGPGTPVEFRWTVGNVGGVTYTQHTLTDEVLGGISLPNGGNFSLAPGAETSLTATLVVSDSAVYTSTWTATSPQTSNASDVVNITVDAMPSIDSAAFLSVPRIAPQRPISYFTPGNAIITYRVTNTGNVGFNTLEMADSLAGTSITPISLPPSGSVVITDTVALSGTGTGIYTPTVTGQFATASRTGTYTFTQATGAPTLEVNLAPTPDCANPADQITARVGDVIGLSLLWRNFTSTELRNQSAVLAKRIAPGIVITNTLFADVDFFVPPGGFGIQACEAITVTRELRGRNAITVTWNSNIYLPLILKGVGAGSEGAAAGVDNEFIRTDIDATDGAVLEVLDFTPAPLLGNVWLLLLGLVLLSLGVISLTLRSRVRVSSS